MTPALLTPFYYNTKGGYPIGVTKFLFSAGLFLLAFTSLSIAQPVFDTPVNLGPKINSPAYESDPFFTADGKKLFFMSTRDGSEDIWYSDWTDTGWTNAQKLGPEINSLERELAPSVSSDGQKLYYVTFARPGATYTWDVWVSMWDSMQNDWAVPLELPCPVNTPGVEYSGRIGPDGETLYFFSTLGSCDSIQQSGLLFSVFDSVSGWSRPQSLGPNINNGNDPQYPTVEANGNWLYFERLVPDGASIFASPWAGSAWGVPFDLRTQIGERAGTPFITPSGESLFFSSFHLGGEGSGDIFLMEWAPTGGISEEKLNLPHTFELYQNLPNPFNGQTRIKLFVSRSSSEVVSLTVYNVLGQPIRNILKNEPVEGKQEHIWDGRDNSGKEVSSGIYLYELRVGNQRVVKKAILLK